MQNLDVYREIVTWKKPLQVSRTQLARVYLKLLPKVEVIGITGSVGKTLTQNAIYSVLSQKFKTVVGDENLDPTFRIPQTILAAKPWHQKMILEYGIEHQGDMDHYLNLVKPHIAVITLIAPTHTKYLKDVEGVFAEKSKLLMALSKDGYAVLNADDPYCRKMAKMIQAKVWWYGRQPRGPLARRAKNMIKISHFKQDFKGSQFRMHYLGQKATVKWKVVGEHQLLSAYAAATVGLIYNLTLKQIAKGLSRVKSPLHRLNPIAKKNWNILDDTYNSSPKAVVESLKTLVELGANRKKIAVLGEMKDLGDLSISAHKLLGGKIASSKVNYLVTIGKVASQIAKAAKKASFKGKIITVLNTQQALRELKRITDKKTLILVKGSRHAHLERIILGLLDKSTGINCFHCGELK